MELPVNVLPLFFKMLPEALLSSRVVLGFQEPNLRLGICRLGPVKFGFESPYSRRALHVPDHWNDYGDWLGFRSIIGSAFLRYLNPAIEAIQELCYHLLPVPSYDPPA